MSKTLSAETLFCILFQCLWKTFPLESINNGSVVAIPVFPAHRNGYYYRSCSR